MKKIALVLILGMLAVGVSFADHPDDQLGIGFVLNTGGGGNGFLLNPGLSLKIPNVPVFWGFNFQPGSLGNRNDFVGLGITGDYYLLERNLVTDTLTNEEDGSFYNLKIDWYLGLGGFADFLFWKDHNPGFAFGLRIPAGVSWHIVRQVELTLGVVPGVGLYFGPTDNGFPRNNFHWSIGGELAMRYWFAGGSSKKNDNGNAGVNANVETMEAIESDGSAGNNAVDNEPGDYGNTETDTTGDTL